MRITECPINGFCLKIISASIFLPLLVFILRKLYKKKTSTSKLSEPEPSTALKFKNEWLRHLKEIAQKTSEEANLLSAGLRELNDRTSHQLKQEYDALQEKIAASMAEDRARTQKQMNELEKTIVELGTELRLYRKGIRQENYTSDAAKVQDSTTQKMKVDGSITDQKYPSEAYSQETTESIMLLIKDCMDEIVSESKCNKESFLRDISSFMQEHYKQLQKLSYSIISESLEKLKQLQIDILIVNTERIEKRLLEAFIFLDRKLVDVQAIEETLKFFNRKFLNFADKCDKKWGASCSKFEDSQELVYEARDNLIFSSSKMSRISCLLTQQSSDLEAVSKILKTAINRAMAIAQSEDAKLYNKEKIEQVATLVEDMKNSLENIEKEYSQRMDEVSKSFQTPSKELESFLRYVEDLEVLNDLMKHSAMAYDNMLNPRLRRGGQGDKRRVRFLDDFREVETSSMVSESTMPNSHFRRDGPSRVRFQEDFREVETSSMVSADEWSSYQGGDGFTEFSFDFTPSQIDEIDSRIEGHARETRRPFTLKRMLSVLGDVIKKTAVEDSHLKKNSKEELCSQPPIEDKREHENFNWSSVPTEVSLDAIKDDCLVQNSGSSDEGDSKHEIKS